MLAIVLVSAVLSPTAASRSSSSCLPVYPFAAEMFRQADIPKRLIPGAIALGSFTFTMDALPGSPQIQNIIPTSFFKTDTWAAPWLGTVGAIFILAGGLPTWSGAGARPRRRPKGTARATPRTEPMTDEKLPHPAIALLPLIVVFAMNKIFEMLIVRHYGRVARVRCRAWRSRVTTQISSVAPSGRSKGALLVGILTVLAFAFRACGRSSPRDRSRRSPARCSRR
jgi:H+/gluconate symporter-like permease